MWLKTLFNMVLVSGALLAMSACSAPGNGSQGQHSGPSVSGEEYDASAEGATQSSGLGQDTNFADENNPQSLVMQRTYYFDFNRSEVREEYKPAIFANANYLMAHPNLKIIVEGHTDPRGSREYNVALGERRANAVAELLTTKGVAASQIRVVSYGSERLATTGRTEQDYQKDRRTVIVRVQE